MLNIKYALNGLAKKPFFTIIAIIQLVASLILTYNSMITKMELEDKINGLSSMFQYEQIYRLEDSSDMSMSFEMRFKEKDVNEKLIQFYNYINNSEKFTIVSYYNNSLSIKSFNGINNFLSIPGVPYIIDENYKLVKNYSVNKDFCKLFNLKTQSGRIFTNEDFNVLNDKEVPILLGANYKKIYKIGDKIEYIDIITSEKKYLKVIGILEKETKIYSTSFSTTLLNLDDYIIVSNQEPIFNNSAVDTHMQIYNRIFSSVIIPKDNRNLDEDIKDIVNYANENNLYNITPISAKTMIDTYKEGFSTQLQFLNILFIIVIVFTSISIIVSILNSISKRYNEFGIHILSGATLKDIGVRIFLEIAILTFIAYIITVFLINAINLFMFKLDIALYLFFMCIVLIGIVSIIPLKKLAKKDINSIIRRKE